MKFLIAITLLFTNVAAAQPWKPVVEAAAAKIQQLYVFPDVGAKAAERIRAREAAYESLGSASELAAAVTADLHDVTHDKHLRLLLEPESPHASTEPREVRVARFVAELQKDNYGIARVERLDGNIGYIDLRSFDLSIYSGASLGAAMTLVAYTDALIIDLRQNGGGDGVTVCLLISYLVDGSDPTRLSDLYVRDGNWSQQNWTTPYVPGPKFGGKKPLYILLGRETFSAAEGFAYDLQAMRRAKLIGVRTGGGANAGDEYRVNPLFTVWIPTMRVVNPITKSNWEGTGVMPDEVVPEEQALETALREARERVIESRPPAPTQ